MKFKYQVRIHEFEAHFRRSLVEVFNRDVIELKGESEIANKC